MHTPQLESHISTLTGPGGSSSPAEITAAASGLVDLLENGADLSPAFAVIRRTIGEWSAYAAGPGMWSDNYSDDEQERDHHGPLIIKTLLTVLTKHALRTRDPQFLADAISGTRQLSFFYEIVGGMMDQRDDLLPLVAPLIDHTIEQIASSNSDAQAYDLLCAIQNLSYPMIRSATLHRREYAQYVLSKVSLVELRENWRPFVRVHLEEVRRTYEKMIPETELA